MALSKEMTKKMTEFFLFKFWPAYPADLCGGTRKKGPKGEALKTWLKIPALDEDEANRIHNNMLAQVRFDRKDEDPTRWPHCKTYLNQRRYDDELSNEGFERGGDMIEQVEAVCRVEGCTEPVIGPRFSMCVDHYAEKHDPWKEIRKGEIEKMGLLPRPGEGKREYYARMRDYYLKNQK